MQEIRTKMLLSQQELAGLLGVSQPLIALHENNTRNLSAPANTLFLKMESLWLAQQAEPEAWEPIQEPEYLRERMLKKLNRIASSAAADIKRLSDLLETKRVRHQKLSAKYKLIHAWRGIRTDKQCSLFIDIMVACIRRELEECSSADLQLLGFELECARDRLRRATALLEAMEK